MTLPSRDGVDASWRQLWCLRATSPPFLQHYCSEAMIAHLSGLYTYLSARGHSIDSLSINHLWTHLAVMPISLDGEKKTNKYIKGIHHLTLFLTHPLHKSKHRSNSLHKRKSKRTSPVPPNISPLLFAEKKEQIDLWKMENPADYKELWHSCSSYLCTKLPSGPLLNQPFRKPVAIGRLNMAAWQSWPAWYCSAISFH